MQDSKPTSDPQGKNWSWTNKPPEKIYLGPGADKYKPQNTREVWEGVKYPKSDEIKEKKTYKKKNKFGQEEEFTNTPTGSIPVDLTPQGLETSMQKDKSNAEEVSDELLKYYEPNLGQIDDMGNPLPSVSVDEIVRKKGNDLLGKLQNVNNSIYNDKTMEPYVDFEDYMGIKIFKGLKKDFQKLVTTDFKAGKINMQDIKKLQQHITDIVGSQADINEYNSWIEEQAKTFKVLDKNFKSKIDLFENTDTQEVRDIKRELTRRMWIIEGMKSDRRLQRMVETNGIDGASKMLEEDTYFIDPAPKSNMQVRRFNNLEDREIMLKLKGIKAMEKILNDNPQELSGLATVPHVISQIFQGAWDSTLDIFLGWSNLLVEPEHRNMYHWKNLVNGEKQNLLLSGLGRDGILAGIYQDEINKTPVMSGVQQFFSDAGYQTGTMLPFILTLGVTGANASMTKMLEQGEKLAWKELMVGRAGWKLAGPTYLKSGLAGIISTFPQKFAPMMDKLKANKDSDWLDWAGAIGWATLQSGMNGMSESVGAHFLGRLMGKAITPFMKSGKLFNGSISERALRYFFADNLGEVFEERINDLTSDEFWDMIKGKTGAREYVLDALKRSGYEYLMFMFSSGVQTAAVNNPKEIVNDIRLQSFANHLLDKINSDFQLKDILGNDKIAKDKLEKTVLSLFNIINSELTGESKNTPVFTTAKAQEKAVQYLKMAMQDVGRIEGMKKSGLTEEQIIDGINADAMVEHFQQNKDAILAMARNTGDTRPDSEIIKEVVSIAQSSPFEYRKYTDKLVENSKQADSDRGVQFITDNFNIINSVITEATKIANPDLVSNNSILQGQIESLFEKQNYEQIINLYNQSLGILQDKFNQELDAMVPHKSIKQFADETYTVETEGEEDNIFYSRESSLTNPKGIRPIAIENIIATLKKFGVINPIKGGISKKTGEIIVSKRAYYTNGEVRYDNINYAKDRVGDRIREIAEDLGISYEEANFISYTEKTGKKKGTKYEVVNIDDVKLERLNKLIVEKYGKELGSYYDLPKSKIENAKEDLPAKTDTPISLKEALKLIEDTGTVHGQSYSPLIDAFISSKGIDTDNVKVNIKDEKSNGRLSSYGSLIPLGNYSKGTVNLWHDNILKTANPRYYFAKSLAHEVVHHGIDQLIESNPKFVKEFKTIYDFWAARGENKENKSYTLVRDRIMQENTDKRKLHEFAAEIMTNRHMQEVLNSIQYDGVQKKKMSLFDKFIEMLNKFFQDILKVDLKDNSLLYATISLFDTELNTSQEAAAILDKIAAEIEEAKVENLASAMAKTEAIPEDAVNNEDRTEQNSIGDEYVLGDDELVQQETAKNEYTATVLVSKVFVSADNKSLVNSQLALINDANDLGLDAFKKKYANVKDLENLNAEYKDKYGTDFLTFTYAFMRSRKQYIVAEVDLSTSPNSALIKEQKSMYTSPTPNKMQKSTIMRKQLFDKIVAELEKKGVKLQILPIVRTVGEETINEITGDVDKKGEVNSRLKNITAFTLQKLYNAGYIFIPNKNTQYLVPIASIQSDQFQLTGNAGQDIYNVWRLLLDTATSEYALDTAAQLKRFNNMMGDDTKAFITPEAMQYMNNAKSKWDVSEDGSAINIKSVVLNLDLSTLNTEIDAEGKALNPLHKSIYDAFSQYSNNGILGDGAVFEMRDTHNLAQIVNSVELDKIGLSYKSKISEPGLLIKAAFFKVPYRSPLYYFMENNNIQRIVLKSAVKIGLGKGGKYEKSKPITLRDITDNLENGVSIRQESIITHNIMEDAFMFSKGSPKTYADGYLGSFLTNGWEYFTPNINKDILDVWNEQTDKLIEKLNGIKKEDKIKEVQKFIEGETNLQDFSSVKTMLWLLKNKGDKINDFNVVFSDFYIKNILSKSIERTLKRKIKGSAPVIMPDLGGLTGYKTFVRRETSRNMKKYYGTQKTNEEIEKMVSERMEEYFDGEFLKPGYAIIDRKNAKNLDVTWTNITENKDNEVVITVNPPGFFYDTRVIKIIGITSSNTWQYSPIQKEINDNGNGIVVSVHDFIARSGKDYDIDTVIAFKHKKFIQNLKKVEANKTGDRILKNFENLDLAKLGIPQQWHGTKEDLAKILGKKQVPDFMMTMARIFGIKEERTFTEDGMAIKDSNSLDLLPNLSAIALTANRLNNDLFKIGVSIGVLYSLKLYNQAVYESGGEVKQFLLRDNKGNPFKGNVWDAKQKKYVKGDKEKRIYFKIRDFETNLALMKFLTDLSIDWLSDQRILKLDINVPKVLKVMFTNMPGYDGEVWKVYQGIKGSIGAARDMMKDSSALMDYDYKGYNKITDVIRKAMKQLSDKDNKFLASLIAKVNQYAIDKLKTSQKMTLTAEEIEQVQKNIADAMTKSSESQTDFWNFLFTFYRIGNAAKLENIDTLRSNAAKETNNGKTEYKYFGRYDSGAANFVFAADEWMQYVNKKGKNYLKSDSPFFRLVREIFSRGDYITTNKESAFFYNDFMLPSNSESYYKKEGYTDCAHVITKINGVPHFSYEKKNSLNQTTETLVQPVASFEKYVKALKEIPKYSLSDAEINTVFSSKNLVNWFGVIAMKTETNRKIISDIASNFVDVIIDAETKELSQAGKDAFRKRMYRAILGVSKNNGPITYGFTFTEESSSVMETEKQAKLSEEKGFKKSGYRFSNPSNAIIELGNRAETDKIAEEILNKYLELDLTESQKFVPRRHDETLNSYDDIYDDPNDTSEEEYRAMEEEMEEQERIFYEAEVMPDEVVPAWDEKEEEDNVFPEFFQELPKNLMQKGKNFGLLSRLFKSLMLYPSVIRKEAKKNGRQVAEDEAIDKILAAYYVGTPDGRRTVVLQDVLNAFRLEKSKGRFAPWINGNMINWIIQHGIHGEYATAQEDIDNLTNNLLSNLEGVVGKLQSREAGVEYMDGIVSDIAEGRNQNTGEKYDFLLDLQFDSLGNAVFRGKTYTIFVNASTQQSKFVRKQNTQVTDQLKKLAEEVLGDRTIIQTEGQLSKDVSVRIMMNAIASRYIFDYYTPKLIESHLATLNKIKEEIIKKLPSGSSLRVEGMQRVSGMIKKIQTMQAQIARKKQVLKNKNEMMYYPHIVENIDQFRMSMILNYMERDKMNEKDAIAKTDKILSEWERGAQHVGGVFAASDPFFTRREFDEVSGYRRDNRGVVKAYLRQMNVFMRNQSLFLYQLLNEQYIDKESKQMHSQRIYNDSILRNDTVYWESVNADSLKKGDLITFVTKTQTQDGKTRNTVVTAKVVKNNKNEVVITTNDATELSFSKQMMSSIRAQRGNSILNKLSLSNFSLFKQAGDFGNDKGMTVLKAYVQYQSRILLGMENFMFNIRNFLGGYGMAWSQVGSVNSGEKVTGQKTNLSGKLKQYQDFAAAFESRAKNIAALVAKKKGEPLTKEELDEIPSVTGDKMLDELYSFTLEYKALITGSVDELLGRFGGVLGSGAFSKSDATMEYFQKTGKKIKSKGEEIQRIIDEMKKSGSLNFKKLSKLQRLGEAIDYYYKQFGLYSLPLGFFEAKGSAFSQLFGTVAINPRATESFLRNITAVQTILAMQDRLNWEENKNDEGFRKFFNKYVTSEIYKNVASSQVSYIPGLDKAKIDTTLMQKAFLSMFGHYSIATQAEYIRAWQNMFRQIRRYGLFNATLSRKTLMAMEKLSTGDIYNVKVQKQFYIVMKKSGLFMLSEVLHAAALTAGTTGLDIFTTTLFGAVLPVQMQTLISLLYMRGFSNATSYPFISIAIRALISTLTIMAKMTGDDDDDEEDKESKEMEKINKINKEYKAKNKFEKSFDKIKNELGQQDYVDFKAEQIRKNKGKDIPEEILKRGYVQRYIRKFAQDLPGMGFNRLVAGMIDLTISAFYDDMTMEYTNGIIKSHMPFRTAYDYGMQEIGGVDFVFGADVLSTYFKRQAVLREELSSANKQIESIKNDLTKEDINEEKMKKLELELEQLIEEKITLGIEIDMFVSEGKYQKVNVNE